MNDIDPAKMTEAERTELFNSFAKDVQPARKPRVTATALVSPWIGGVLAQRARGLDWKQIAALFDADLKVKISPSALERAVREITRANTSASSPTKPAQKRKHSKGTPPASTPNTTP